MTTKHRRLWAALLAAGCLLAAGLGASASSGAGEKLASLSYLTGTFLPSLEKGMGERAKAGTQAVRDAALSQVDAVGKKYAQNGGGGGDGDGGSAAGWTVSNVPQPTALRDGDTITLDEGGSILWLCGSAAGTGLVDATAGREVPSGGALTAGHRYLNGMEGSTAAVDVRSDAAQAAPAGRWTLAPGGRDVTPFYDLCQTDWFYQGAFWAYENGIFKGVSATQFDPDGVVDRATLATVLYRMEGSTQLPYRGKFTDVPANQWYTAGVEWAAGAGIVNGNGDGTFTPTGPATREQIAAMLYRYARYLNCDLTAAGSLERFRDSASVSSWAKTAVSWAVGAGLLKGADGALLPQQSATRAQVALLLQRFQTWTGRS